MWKKIPEFNLYEASDQGFIKTFNWKNKGIERIMKPSLDGSGYLRTMLLGDDKKFYTIKVHRIIGITFIDNPENKPQINHKNCIKTDNRVSNLEWVTLSENQIHAYKQNRRSMRGECNSCATLTDREVFEIRANYEFGKKCKKGITKKQIAEKYNTSFNVIKRIVQNKTWKHLL
ncbi:MAG: HNH endonuclease [Candidatus Paceibacterota bacterium]